MKDYASTNIIKSVSLREFAVIVAVFILISYIAVSFFLQYDTNLRTTVSDLMTPIISLIVVISLFYASKESSVFGNRVRIAWTLLALAQLSFTVGEIIWAILEVGFGQSPFPSYADIFYILYYPLFAIGIFLLPRDSIKTESIYKTSIDLGIVMISAALIFWVFLIIPTVQTIRGNGLEAILSLNYIVADFVLLFVLLDMLFNKIKSFTDSSLILLAGGIGALVFTDTAFAYQSLQNIYVSGGFLDVGWVLGYLLIGLAAVFQITKAKTEFVLKSSTKSINHKFFWISYIPLIWVLVAYILLLWGYYQNYFPQLIVLELGVGIIIILIIIREIMSIRENKRLYLEAQKEIKLRKKAEKDLKDALKEKDMMVKEIHHRVKNNLTVFSSLLNLQSRYIKDKEALGIFKESQNRAKSMALIHEYLYNSSDLKRINFGEYIKKLSINLFHTYVMDSSLIKLNIEVEDIMLDINIAIPLGLILNELVTNAMKHAFGEDRSGEINVKFHSNDVEYTLTVSDNGIGIPEEIDYKNTDSLGLRIVNSLTDQIKGKIELDRAGGTTFKIKFKEPEFK